MFQKGEQWKGNKKGRPKGSGTLNKGLLAAFTRLAKKKGKSLENYLVEESETDHKLRLKLIDKVVADIPRAIELPDEISEIIVSVKRKEANGGTG
jgi:hypothetical protein